MKTGIETKKGTNRLSRNVIEMLDRGEEVIYKAHIVGLRSHDEFIPEFISSRPYDTHTLSPLERLFLVSSDSPRLFGYQNLDRPELSSHVVLSLNPLGPTHEARQNLGEITVSVPTYDSLEDGILQSRYDLLRNNKIATLKEELGESQAKLQELIGNIGKHHLKTQLCVLKDEEPTIDQVVVYKSLPEVFSLDGLDSMFNVHHNEDQIMELLSLAKFAHWTCSLVVTNHGTDAPQYETAVLFVKDGSPYAAFADSLRGPITGKQAFYQFMHLGQHTVKGRVEKYLLSSSDFEENPPQFDRADMNSFLLDYTERSDSARLTKITEEDLAQH